MFGLRLMQKKYAGGLTAAPMHRWRFAAQVLGWVGRCAEL